MKNFVLAVKIYFLGCLISIAPHIPIMIAMSVTWQIAWASPYASLQQSVWFAVYSLVTASYYKCVEITEHLINKALQDDKA